MKRVGGMGNFNLNESRTMTKVINRKTKLVLKIDCCITYFLQAADSAGIDIDQDLALIDYTNAVIEFEGNDDSFLNVLKGKL